VGHPEVILHVQMTPADHTVWSRFISRDSKRGLWRYGSAIVFIATVVCVVGLGYVLSLTSLPPAPALVISIGLSWLLVLKIWRKICTAFQPSLFDPDGAYLRPYEIKISEDELLVRDDLNESRYSWRSFRRVEETPEHIYLFIDKAMAVIVPERCFANAEERAQFKSIVRDKIAANGVPV
jgi:hypothetical protein